MKNKWLNYIEIKGESKRKNNMKENKFSCPVSMKVTQEQYERDLKQGLLDLGYDVSCVGQEASLLCTNSANIDSRVVGLIYLAGDCSKDRYERYFIDHYNPKLFLALAGMREGNIAHIGEVINYDGDLVKVTNECIRRSGNSWKKANKEEIIDWFTKPLETEVNLGSEYANDVVKGLRSEIENLKKENDELKGYTRRRRGYVDTYNKSDSPSLGEIKIWESPLTPEEVYIKKSDDVGYKESENKLSYELDWDFIESMAKRMQKGSEKYSPYNWKKPLNPEQLKQALLRHVVEVMKGNYNDEGVDLDHILAISCNSMMLWYQLKHNKIDE